MADMNRLISLDESVANAYLIRARLHRIRGNYWSSLSDYNRARKLDPYQTFFSITRVSSAKHRNNSPSSRLREQSHKYRLSI
jgi:hypothetical protein